MTTIDTDNDTTAAIRLAATTDAPLPAALAAATVTAHLNADGGFTCFGIISGANAVEVLRNSTTPDDICFFLAP